MSDPCQGCGACCASFRVSFYWGETDAHPLGCVPSALTKKINDTYVCMAGTETQPVRCQALEGALGVRVRCQIYAHRSSTCREFSVGSSACQEARARHGLPAI